MGWEYELETDIRYLQGVDKGIEQGIEKGIKQGIEKGIAIIKQEANLKFVTFLLSSTQFSTQFSTEEIAKLVGVEIEFVEKVKRELQ